MLVLQCYQEFETQKTTKLSKNHGIFQEKDRTLLQEENVSGEVENWTWRQMYNAKPFLAYPHALH